MSWIDAMSNRGSATVNVDALRGVLPVINMIEAAKGQPRSTLSDVIDRARSARNSGDYQAALAAARRKVAAEEAALKAAPQHMTGHKLPGEEISSPVPFGTPDANASPEPVAKPHPAISVAEKATQLPENVTRIRRRRPPGITVSYLE